jgi:hypothetical protein
MKTYLLLLILFPGLHSFTIGADPRVCPGEGVPHDRGRDLRLPLWVSKDQASPADLTQQAYEAYDKKDYARSAALYEQAIAKGARDSETLYNAACTNALLGNKNMAFALLEQVTKSGWRNTAHLQKDSDLDSLRADPRWPKIIAASDAQQAKYHKDHSDPNKARFITEDIARFWKAYDLAMAAPAGERAAIFEREYIAPATIGAKDFARSGRLKASQLAATIATRPKFYAAIRPVTMDLAKPQRETIAAFRKLKQIYPDAIFPATYFVVGQMQSGGTASDNGLLMGAEMFTRAPSVPLDELDDWGKSAMAQPDEIPALVAHESIHFQQKYPARISLLCQCLKEGSADFIGELIAGRMIKRMQDTHAWANARERELWVEFQKDMPALKTSRWLYGSSGGNGRPVDLGYWMGYKISEAYYKQAADKKQAVRDILVMKDCDEFLKTSGYAAKFASGPAVQK